MKPVISTYIILTYLLFSSVWANVKLPAIISDNMVLQADAGNPVWGWADPNEKITVKIDSQIFSTIAGVQGKWNLALKPLAASSKPLEMTITGKNVVTIHNIIVGQVWLGSGQSNMTMPIIKSEVEASPGVIDANNEIRNAEFPDIRLFTVKRAVSHKTLEDCKGEWLLCSPETVPDFSAALYFFGKYIHQQLHQPVGLIHASWGGTPVEAWTSRPALEAEPVAAPIIRKWEDILKASPEKTNDHHQPSVLYNAMITPIIPFRIKGVIWYQGESNADRAWQYRKLFPLMIADWRKHWQQGNFPFYFVQIANLEPYWPEPQWAELRQAQLETVKSVTGTGMAVAIDIGEPNEIHPGNKQEIGRRLALLALAKTYGKNIECSGPVYKNYKVEANSVRIFFDNLDGKLIAKNGPLNQFTIAGANQKFYPANAIIVDSANKGDCDKKMVHDTIVVSSPYVSTPVAVRYAWSSNPDGANLYNTAGLPASPFKTDEWPWVTENAI